MPFLFDYILKLSISLTVIYLFYQLVLRKLTFYNWNRWYLFGYTLLSFIIPFIDISSALEKNEWSKSEVFRFIPAIEVNDQVVHSNLVAGNSWTQWNWVFLLLLCGMGFLLLQFVIRYLSFLNVRRKATLLSDGEMKLFQVDKDIIPFSFGNAIFINQQLHDEAELKEIIRHEFVHVKQRHTHDIIWSELLCIVNWYNPFVWLIRKAIRQNLEFIADDKVIETGLDKKQYQYLLLKVIGNNHFSIANQFNFSSLKKRIAMMNKMKSARSQLIKFLFILPLVAVMLLAFRNEKKNWQTGDRQNSSIIENLQGTNDFIDSIPPPPPPPPTPPEPLKMPENVKRLDVQDGKATVILKDGTEEKYDLNKAAEKKEFEKKYGKILPPPPPPPAVPATVPELNVNVTSENNNVAVSPPVIATTSVASTINSNVSANVNANVSTSVNRSINSSSAVTVAPAVGINNTFNTAISPVKITQGVGSTMTTAVSPVKITQGVGSTMTTAVSPVMITKGIGSTMISAVSPVKITQGVGSTMTTAVSPVMTAQGINSTMTASVSPVTTLNGVSGHFEGETVMELKIFKSTSREKLDKMVAEAKAKGVELEFEKIEYNNKNELIHLNGKMEKDKSKNTFSATGFEVVTLLLIKNDDKYSCRVYVNSQKEVM